MEKIILLVSFLLLLGCSTLTLEQPKRTYGIQPTPNGTIQTKYDEFDKQTTVYVRRMILQYPKDDGTPSDLTSPLELGIITGDSDIVSVMISRSGIGWSYLGCNYIKWLLDGEPFLEFRKAQHDGNVFSGGYVSEHVSQYLRKKEFLEMANARSLRGRLCNTEFSLTPEQIDTLKKVENMLDKNP